MSRSGPGKAAEELTETTHLQEEGTEAPGRWRISAAPDGEANSAQPARGVTAPWDSTYYLSLATVLDSQRPRDRPLSEASPSNEPSSSEDLGAIPAREVEHLRSETPGCAHRIHLNNAGAALQPRAVTDAVRAHLDLEERIGGYEAADDRAAAIEAAYHDVAALVGARRENIAFAVSATVAFSQALSSVPFRPGDRIVTTRNDYASNQIMYLSLEARMGVEVIRASDSPSGGVDVRALEGIVHRKAPRLVAMSHVPTNSGLVQDAKAVGEICRKKGVLFLLDACQSVGQMPVDVATLGCDFLAATSRKFLRGPRGAGFLYVSDRVLDEPLEPLFPDLRGADWIDDDVYQPAPDASRFETWETSPAALLGMGEAAACARRVGLDRIERRTRSLASLLRELLQALPGVRVLDRGDELCAIVTLTAEGHEPRALVGRLREVGVNTSASELESGLLDFRDKGVTAALRLSPHYYNREDEVEHAVQAIDAILGNRAPPSAAG